MSADVSVRPHRSIRFSASAPLDEDLIPVESQPSKLDPADLLGRTIGATSVLNYGLMPLGGVTAGLLGTTMGVRGAIAVMAATVLLGSLLHVVSPLWGRRDLPSRMPPRTPRP